MIDYLLAPREDDKRALQNAMSGMVYCRDIRGLNVLATYFATDLGINKKDNLLLICFHSFLNLDLGEHFLTQHITTNGFDEHSGKFMICLDMTPLSKNYTKLFYCSTSNIPIIFFLQCLWRMKETIRRIWMR